jgi:hypothetical protein
MSDVTPFARALLSTADGVASSALESAIAAARATVPEGVRIGHGRRVGKDPLEGTPHRDLLGRSPPRFDAYVETSLFSAGDPALPAAALRDILDRIGPLISRDESSVICGNRHLLLPMQGPYMMIFALRRLPALSHEAFMDYWYNRHGKLVANSKRDRGGSYYQLHADAEMTWQLAGNSGFTLEPFDGHAGGWMRNLEKLTSNLHSPTAARALADERRFIDHSRSFMGIYQVMDDQA